MAFKNAELKRISGCRWESVIGGATSAAVPPDSPAAQLLACSGLPIPESAGGGLYSAGRRRALQPAAQQPMAHRLGQDDPELRAKQAFQI
jgi:hypothetical protein